MIENRIIDNKNFLFNIKAMGFSDKKISLLTKKSLSEIVQVRHKHKIFPVYKRVDTCSAEFFLRDCIFI